MLINAVKDVAKALAELISATKCAAGKAADDPSMFQLKSAAKVQHELFINLLLFLYNINIMQFFVIMFYSYIKAHKTW